MIVRIHHAQITVLPGAEGQAREFYCRTLGLPEVDKPASLAGRGGLDLRVGDQQVHIGTEGGVELGATKAHLAHEVDDLHARRERLQAFGIAALEGVPIPGYHRFAVRNPFGNRVEFVQAL